MARYDILRCTNKDNLAATGTALRSHVDDPVCLCNQLQPVFDHYDRITFINQFAK